MKKIRIAFLGCGVLEIPSYVDLLNELSREFEITLYAEYFHEHHRSKNFTIKKVSRLKLPRRLRELNFFFLVLFNLIIKKHHVIHCQSTFPAGFIGLIIGKILNKKVIVGLDAAELSMVKDIHFGDLLNPKRRNINKHVIQKADVVTTLSKFHDNEIHRNLGKPRVTIIVPWRIKSSKFPAHKTGNSGTITFLNIAYLHPVKDQEMLLKVIQKVAEKRPCKLIHIGKDYWNGHIQKLAKDMEISSLIQFKGFVSNDELQNYFSQADFLLQTSRFESQGVVFLEALSSGVPVVATKVGLFSDLSGYCCETVEPQNAEAMAEKIIHLIENPDRKNEIIKNGFDFMAQNDLAETVKQYTEIYLQLK